MLSVATTVSSQTVPASLTRLSLMQSAAFTVTVSEPSIGVRTGCIGTAASGGQSPAPAYDTIGQHPTDEHGVLGGQTIARAPSCVSEYVPVPSGTVSDTLATPSDSVNPSGCGTSAQKSTVKS